MNDIRPRAARLADPNPKTGDEHRLIHMPCGHLFNLALVSYWKRLLLNAAATTAAERLKYLEGIQESVFGPVTAEAVALIEPACDAGNAMIGEICSLDVNKQARVFVEGDVFRLLVELNPSLLVALRLCSPYVPANSGGDEQCEGAWR
jgi:hypothetical protein